MAEDRRFERLKVLPLPWISNPAHYQLWQSSKYRRTGRIRTFKILGLNQVAMPNSPTVPYNGRRDGIRTHTAGILSPVTLPIGLLSLGGSGKI